jgi:hypothetical protein
MTYAVPRDPSANRVYVWRKLKRLGAIALQDAVWVLPETPLTKEQLQWLAAEIAELGGQCTLWRSQPLGGDQDAALVRQFEAPLEVPYRRILARLKGKKANLAGLSRLYQQLQARDYLHSALGQQVRDALAAARGVART